jgi:hypothetical protein
MRRVTSGAVSLLVAAAVAACAGLTGPHRQYDLRFQGDTPRALSANPTDVELLDAIAWLMVHKLELPLPESVKAYVYVNEATLVDGLITIAGDKPDDAWDRGRFAAGVATRVGLFLRGDYLVRMHLVGRAGLLAHELAHVSQTKLREGGRGRAPQWLEEGHADWVKFRALELLGYRSYAESRDEIVRSVVRSETPITLFPDLQALASNARWTRATNELGPPATYGQAFLAVDWLVERHGSAKVVEFLRRFARGTPPREHWDAVFPIAPRQFADEFRARLGDLGRATPAAGAGSPAASPPSSSR